MAVHQTVDLASSDMVSSILTRPTMIKPIAIITAYGVASYYALKWVNGPFKSWLQRDAAKRVENINERNY